MAKAASIQSPSKNLDRLTALRALLVHNPTAGTGGHDKNSLANALQLAGIKSDYISTKDGGLKRALLDPHELVVAAGGDGTVAYVFAHLAHRSVPIGILPLGSANNIARSLGIAGTPLELAEGWRSARKRPFHMIEIAYEDEEADLCSEGFGLGLIPALIERRAKGKKSHGADDIRRGRLAFEAVLADAQSLDLEIRIDGKPWNHDLLSLDILNISLTGPALPLADGADPSDKILDAVGFETGKRTQLNDWIRSPHRDPPPAVRRAGKCIEIRWRGATSRLDSALVKAKPNWQYARLRSDPEPLNILTTLKAPAVAKKDKRR